MATKSLTYRQIIDLVNDVGELPEKGFDETLTLSGFSALIPGQRLALAAAADDQAVTFTAGALILIFSHDNGFKVRLGAGETLSGLMRSFSFVAQNATNTALSTSILLTGNGSNVADLEIWIIEKYTA